MAHLHHAETMSRGERLPRYEVGIDSYRAAKILIDQHGECAKARAGQRLQELLDQGDEAGAAAWTDIVFAIDEIQRGPLPGEVRN
jgi:hypothetical protein